MKECDVPVLVDNHIPMYVNSCARLHTSLVILIDLGLVQALRRLLRGV